MNAILHKYNTVKASENNEKEGKRRKDFLIKIYFACVPNDWKNTQNKNQPLR